MAGDKKNVDSIWKKSINGAVQSIILESVKIESVIVDCRYNKYNYAKTLIFED